MIKQFILTIGGLFFVLCTWAQAPLRLTLQESIKIASDSSLQSFRTKNLYMASYWQYRTFQAARLPSLTLNMNPLQYFRDFTRRYDLENNVDVYRTQQSLYSSGNLSIHQNLDATGGTFFIDSELGFLRSIGQTSYSQFSSVPIRIGYSQSLMGFNAFKWEKKIEPLKYEKAKKQFIYSAEEISESVIELFFDLAMARAEYELAVDNVASSDTLLRIGQERFKIAAISQADQLTLKLDAINAKNTLKNAEITLKKALFNFSSYLNIKEETPLDIILPQKPKDFLIPVEEALEYARENNPEYLNNQGEILEAEREVERAIKGSAFNANLSVSTGFNQVADNMMGAYRSPLQQNLVSVGLSIPIMDWGIRKGKVNMARNSLNVVRISARQKELSLVQEVMLTVSDFNMQQDMINSAEEALELAVAAYNATKQRFIIGKSDMNSLTLSLNRQKDAQKNYIFALKNYWLSTYKIRRLTLYDFERQASLTYLFDIVNQVY